MKRFHSQTTNLDTMKKNWGKRISTIYGNCTYISGHSSKEVITNRQYEN